MSEQMNEVIENLGHTKRRICNLLSKCKKTILSNHALQQLSYRLELQAYLRMWCALGLVPEEAGGSIPHSLHHGFGDLAIGMASQKLQLKAHALRSIAEQLDDDAKNTNKAK